MSAKVPQNDDAQTQAEDSSDGSWKVVDDRPFECPNGHGIMDAESTVSVYCKDCNYSRSVFAFVEDE